MKTKTFKVTVRAEPNVLADNYPNFHHNYEALVQGSLRGMIQTLAEGLDELTIGENGYDIKVTEEYVK